ncbi:hypothetical protein BCD67_21755 [Oscillatoriales cyanobacterium USR001]|nr:hypothetical protein BCD67_21755 [Oscillatoriales cyanobacterium USR001]
MMSRGIRLTIVGIIFGLLSTLATEEMRCLFRLSQTLNCYQCLAHHSVGHWFFPVFSMLYIIVSIAYPENFEEFEKVFKKLGFNTYEKNGDAFCLFGGFLFLIISIFAMNSCLK